MLSKEQSQKIKKQIFEQIEKSDVQNKEEIKKTISEMNESQLEEFLKQQNMAEQNQCIFCSIIEGKIPSYKIAENSEAIAVLEINPVSLGHAIIIPKTHDQKTSKKSIELSQKIAEALKILKPKKIDVLPSTMFGHEILNVIPVYTNETLESPRKKESEENLKKLLKNLKEIFEKPEEKKELQKPEKKPRTITEENTWLPKRIP